MPCPEPCLQGLFPISTTSHLFPSIATNTTDSICMACSVGSVCLRCMQLTAKSTGTSEMSKSCFRGKQIYMPSTRNWLLASSSAKKKRTLKEWIWNTCSNHRVLWLQRCFWTLTSSMQETVTGGKECLRNFAWAKDVASRNVRFVRERAHQAVISPWLSVNGYICSQWLKQRLHILSACRFFSRLQIGGKHCFSH